MSNQLLQNFVGEKFAA